ncbi:MAG: sugar nucleotide-binding protein, partial [Flavobacteriaceae bacterium]
KEPPKGVYHFSDEQIMSWFDFAEKILEEHQLDNPITPIATSESGVIRPQYSPIFSNKKF